MADSGCSMKRRRLDPAASIWHHVRMIDDFRRAVLEGVRGERPSFGGTVLNPLERTLGCKMNPDDCGLEGGRRGHGRVGGAVLDFEVWRPPRHPGSLLAGIQVLSPSVWIPGQNLPDDVLRGLGR